MIMCCGGTNWSMIWRLMRQLTFQARCGELV
ncbi:hypothetical protein KSS87_007974, partial [Heliosperma pusillum]